MEKYYCVKIDKRRKKAIETFEEFYKIDSITKFIISNMNIMDDI